VIFDESDFTVSDGNDGSFFDEFGCLSFEEGVGGGSLVGDDGSDEGG
jgi:hypothetical protein